jgi:hypothetical protein
MIKIKLLSSLKLTGEKREHTNIFKNLSSFLSPLDLRSSTPSFKGKIQKSTSKALYLPSPKLVPFPIWMGSIRIFPHL